MYKIIILFAIISLSFLSNFQTKNDNLTVENYHQYACSKYYDDACDHINN
jgi:hypothetical protein